MTKQLLSKEVFIESCGTESYRSLHNIPPPPPFPPVKVIRCGKHIGYKTLAGEFIPVSPTSNEVPTQWILLFVSVFLFVVAVGCFVCKCCH